MLTRSPTCAWASPAMPSIGETILVKLRFRLLSSLRLSILELAFGGRDSCFGGADLSFRVGQLRSRCFNACSLRINLCFRSHVCLQSVVEILLRNGFLLSERTVFLHIEICLDLICLCLSELRLCL